MCVCVCDAGVSLVIKHSCVHLEGCSIYTHHDDPDGLLAKGHIELLYATCDTKQKGKERKETH